MLIEGKAIQLHPLVCAAFNADFDGDQMAVHVPLSLEAQLEARVLMMSTNNILHPANGQPIIVPSQDIVLGLYYLSLMRDGDPGQGKAFGEIAEIEHALAQKVVSLHSKIRYRWNGLDEKGKTVRRWFDTTPGRVLLGQVLPRSTKVSFDAVNKLMTKREISDMIDTVYRHCGQKETVIFCDRIMALGFHHAFKAGISFGKDDMVVPSSKWKIVDQTRTLAKEFEQQFNEGLITQGEKYNKVVDAWSKTTDAIADGDDAGNLRRSVSDEKTGRERQINSIYMMAHSGARGSPAQMRQLAGMRGLMAKPSGEIIETPIISNFKEGLYRARVLQLDPRRPQGPRRHRLEDGQLGLPDAPSRRRGAGLHHHERGLRHHRRHQGARHHRRRHGGGLAGKPHPRPHRGGGYPRPATNKIIVPKGTLLEELHVDTIMTAGGAGGAHPLGADLRNAPTATCGKCYGRDLARGTPRQHGRGGRRHRGAVDRRAGHPAHHAHVPHRRRGSDQRAVVHRVELRRHDQDQEQEHRPQLRRRPDRDGPQHDRGDRGPGRHRACGAPHPVRRAHAHRRRRQDQARPAHRRMGPLYPADADRGRGHDRLRGSRRGRSR